MGRKLRKLEILYEDNHLIVVVKPVNILSQKDITNDIDMVTIVKEYIKEKYHKPGNVYLGLVHRLDRVVGGIMVFAKTSKAAKRISQQIKNHTFKKTYLAVVSNNIKKDNDFFIDYLEKDKDGFSKVVNKDIGKYSSLSYEVIERVEDKALVKINLQTGRHHQIRVQFATRKYPICGDQRYGELDNTQIALWAYSIEFVHPVTKEILTFTKLPTNKPYFQLFKYINNR